MGTKKKRTVEIIEATPHPEVEHSFFRFPGKEIVEDTSKSSEFKYEFDPEIMKEYMRHYNIKPDEHYTQIHTHPSFGMFGDRIVRQRNLPSGEDINNFLLDKNNKERIIALRNNANGKVVGLTILRKTKKTPKILDNLEEYEFSKKHEYMLKDTEQYNKVAGIIYQHRKALLGDLSRLAGKYNFRYKFLPAEGYYVDKDFSFRKKKTEKHLEGKVVAGVISLIFIASIFFLSSNLTGNAIGNLTQRTSNIIGIVLFIASLIELFFIMKRRKN